ARSSLKIRLPTHRYQSRCPLAQQAVYLGERRFRQRPNRSPISFRRRAAHIDRELLQACDSDEISHRAIRAFHEPDRPFRGLTPSRAAAILFPPQPPPVSARATTTPLRGR